MANQIPEIISKKHVDLIFSLEKDKWEYEWEKECEKFFAPGWTVRSGEHDTGKHVAAYNPSTGIGFSIHPLYTNEQNLPEMVIIASYFPVGVLSPMTEEIQKEMEAVAQQNLGETYRVRLIYRRLENLESIELMLTKP